MRIVPKKIEGVKFGLLSPEHIRKFSEVKVITADTYDEDGYPVEGGLMDPRLGVVDPGLKCKVCGGRVSDCPGHFGRIELARPVIHVGYAKQINRMLQATCRKCGRLLLNKEKIADYGGQIKKAKKVGKSESDIVDELLKSARNTKKCMHCGEAQKEIKFEKPTTFIEDKNRLSATDVRERLERITGEDAEVMGFDLEVARPEWMILTVLPVPPVAVRPSITLESGERSEDDMTHKLVDILRINQRLMENVEAGAPHLIIEDLWELLQYHVTTYFNNEVAGIPPARHRSGRPLKTLTQRLKGKEGRFRSNLSGKRVNFSARTVVAPDPNISINEVGVPEIIARELTIPIRITRGNIKELTELVKRGPDNYPGANYIERIDGGRVRLGKAKNMEEVLEKIEVGGKIHRHLRDGDVVMFNRQPSLHRMSIMAHEVKVMPYRTFRLNLCVCPPYNADFDGDEMNLHAIQGEEARAEARVLMRVQEQILSPRFGGPIIGGIHDHISGAYLFTRKEVKFKKNDAFKLLYSSGIYEELPEPLIENGAEYYTGKQLFSLLLPKDLNLAYKAKICKKCDVCDEENCKYDAYVLIKDGQILCGVMDEKSFGAFAGNLLDRIVKDYGADEARTFLDRVTKLVINAITMIGFSTGIDDEDIPAEAIARIEEILNNANGKVQELIKAYDEEILDQLPGRTLEETLEMRIMQTLSEARDMTGSIANQYLEQIETMGKENSARIMAVTGARGSLLNLTQMAACIGQQAVRGERILRGYSGRTLPHFKKGDKGARAHGFVRSNYKKGLDPLEYFFHSMGGREGLVDTAVRTSQSGYMQRRLINALQDLKVEYDNTVRETRGTIIEFQHGEDGVDPSRTDWGLAVNVKKTIREFAKTHAGGAGRKKEPLKEKDVLKKLENVKDVFPESIYADLVNELSKIEVAADELDKILDEIRRRYEYSLVEPGEAVGVVAAQSMGEPSTQMTMRTFHYAGVAELNVTLGLPRIIELVDARREPSTPTMTIYLEEDCAKDQEKAKEIANKIGTMNVGDLVEKTELDLIDSRVTITFDEDQLTRKEISIEDVIKKLNASKIRVAEGWTKNKLSVTSSKTSLKELRKLTNKIKEVNIRGIKGIQRVVMRKEGDEYVIYTEGSNLKDVLKINGVDIRRTRTNDIHEIESVLGIEAARNAIIGEALDTLDEQGLKVDVRHLILISEMMCVDGTVKAIGRHGVSGEKASVLARAAFELTVDHLLKAGIRGEVEHLDGIVENVIVGRPVRLGTGMVELVMKREQQAKEKGSGKGASG